MKTALVCFLFLTGCVTAHKPHSMGFDEIFAYCDKKVQPVKTIEEQFDMIPDMDEYAWGDFNYMQGLFHGCVQGVLEREFDHGN